MKNILIIGGGGYIGTVVSKFLLNSGHKVKVLDNFIYDNLSAVKELQELQNFSLVNGDMCSENIYQNLMKDITDVIILGGLVGDPITKKYPELHNKINVKGVKNCINILKKHSFNKLIFISTCSNYGLISDSEIADENFPLNPLSLYAKAKVEIENFILSLKEEKINFDPVILRFATAFGASPRMRFDLTINEFAFELLKGNELLVYDPDTWRPYCHVKDFSNAFITVLNSPKEKVAYNVFNVGDTKENYTKKMLVDEIKKIIPNSKIKYVAKNDDPRDYRVNCDKIKNELGFKISMTVPDGIMEIKRVILENLIKDPEDQKYYNIPHE